MSVQIDNENKIEEVKAVIAEEQKNENVSYSIEIEDQLTNEKHSTIMTVLKDSLNRTFQS